MIILDDCFPCIISNFRVQEYNWYLKKYSDCVAYSSYTAPWKKIYSEKYPELTNRVKHYEEYTYKNVLHYTIFINNAYAFLSQIDKKFPFIFTLYPGGGFHMDIKESDAKLKYVFNHSNFKKVIVTQKATFDYLVKKGLAKNKIEYRYGGILFTELRDVKKLEYKKDKDTFDVCFVANRYDATGLSKGYDVFLDVAKSFKNSDIRFHVVGPYDKTILNIGKANIIFHGMKYNDFFPDFYSKMDIMLSPNILSSRYPGSFDGFPTGCGIEAGLNGVAVFCTDPLNMNETYKSGEEIEIISTDSNKIRMLIEKYYKDPTSLYCLSNKGKIKFREIFSVKNQLDYRTNILEEFL